MPAMLFCHRKERGLGFIAPAGNADITLARDHRPPAVRRPFQAQRIRLFSRFQLYFMVLLLVSLAAFSYHLPS